MLINVHKSTKISIFLVVTWSPSISSSASAAGSSPERPPGMADMEKPPWWSGRVWGGAPLSADIYRMYIDCIDTSIDISIDIYKISIRYIDVYL